jgi:hypothetical protein
VVTAATRSPVLFLPTIDEPGGALTATVTECPEDLVVSATAHYERCLVLLAGSGALHGRSFRRRR